MISDKESWDVFISHAHEDKEDIARPLALALRRRGLRVWYDDFSLGLGDSLRKAIDCGLANSRFGIVILSPNFFAKQWTEAELSALYTRQQSEKDKVILPILHNIRHEEIRAHSPLVADLVSISTTLPLPDIVDRVLSAIHIGLSNPDLKKILPTGIRKLDQALGGGLPRPSSIVLIGPKGIGKTTLALQILLSALDRKEPCLYITYREAPYDIIRYMLKLGAPVEAYVKSGLFRILDNFSAPNGLSAEEVKSATPGALLAAILRVDDPTDTENYYKMQVEIMEEIGMGGVNVIDSTNTRYRMLGESRKPSTSASKYFQRFKARLGGMGGQSALHLATELPGHEEFNMMIPCSLATGPR